MSNSAYLDNSLVDRATTALSGRLPQRWKLSLRGPQRSMADFRPAALLEVRAPDGGRGVLLVEAKRSLTAQQAVQLGEKLASVVASGRLAGALVVTPFASPMARDRLRRAGVSYLDLTGNTHITLDRPGLVIETQGADKNPAPPRRGIKSLKGGKAARLVRALCDWRPPVGVRELARRAGTDPGYTTRVLTLLRQDDLVRRAETGQVTEVNWRDLITRWAQDYDLAKTNRTVPCLAPRGFDFFTNKLRSYNGRYALTGTFAVPPPATVVPGRLAICYVDVIERAAEQLDVRPAPRGANVLLLEPFDPVVWERTRNEAGLVSVALSQCAVDLLSGGGREPAQGEALLTWMGKNENAWRT